MKVVILAGGLPSAISADNDKIPKPMVQIGERPILWHIMKLYSYYGFDDFIICTGYRSDLIKQYFMNFYIYRSDITVDLQNNDIKIHNNLTEPWNVTIVDTGLEATTGRRIKKIENYIEDDDFIVAYGDCISNINIKKFVEKHKQSGKQMTIALAKPTGRNEILPINGVGEVEFMEDIKYRDNHSWVNACNMVVNKSIFGKIIDEKERFEVETLQNLAKENQISTFKHYGFWQPVETMRDKILLQNLWDSRNIPWKIWDN